ncbi:hypothetical protein ACFVYF_16060 [Streptomyces sp. NPDC058274]|uniref:hypothetical protein n=1 Tax=Streptomyces sp. NPDC058274 TaxID=3346416 RepID=UPI0036E32222
MAGHIAFLREADLVALAASPVTEPAQTSSIVRDSSRSHRARTLYASSVRSCTR